MIIDDAAEPLEAVVVEGRSQNPIATVFAWIGLALVVFIVGWWVWTRWIDPSAGGTIARYVNSGGGVAFESPPDEFRVTTPTQWQRNTATNEFGTIVTVSDEPGEYEFSVTKTPQSEAAIVSYKSTLNQIAGQLAAGSNAEIVSQKPAASLQDVAVKSIVYRKDGTYWRAAILLLKDRLYTLIVKAPNDDPAPFDRMRTSFQILGPR